MEGEEHVIECKGDDTRGWRLSSVLISARRCLGFTYLDFFTFSSCSFSSFFTVKARSSSNFLIFSAHACIAIRIIRLFVQITNAHLGVFFNALHLFFVLGFLVFEFSDNAVCCCLRASRLCSCSPTSWPVLGPMAQCNPYSAV